MDRICDITQKRPEIVDEDSPNRCIHQRGGGSQCRLEIIPNEKYCLYHIKLHEARYRPEQKLKRFRLCQHHARVNELAYSQDAISLEEHAGMLDVLLEELWNQCHTPWDFQVNQAKIENLVEKISKIKLTSVKLQVLMGQSLGKPVLAELSDNWLKIISEEIKDTDVLKRLSTKFGEALEKAADKSKSNALSTANA